MRPCLTAKEVGKYNYYLGSMCPANTLKVSHDEEKDDGGQWTLLVSATLTLSIEHNVVWLSIQQPSQMVSSLRTGTTYGGHCCIPSNYQGAWHMASEREWQEPEIQAGETEAGPSSVLHTFSRCLLPVNSRGLQPGPADGAVWLAWPSRIPTDPRSGAARSCLMGELRNPRDWFRHGAESWSALGWSKSPILTPPGSGTPCASCPAPPLSGLEPGAGPPERGGDGALLPCEPRGLAVGKA